MNATTEATLAATRPLRGIANRIRSMNLVARTLVFGIVWLLVWRAAVLLEFAPHASIWFPPAGLSFAAFLVVGWRAVPIVMVCAVTSMFWIDSIYQEHRTWSQLLFSGVLWGVAHCASYLLGARLLRRLAIDMIKHSLPKLIIGFLCFGSAAALLSAILGSQALVVTGAISPGEAARAILPWWIGDMAGVIVLAPFFIAVISHWYPEITPWLGGFRFAGPVGKRSGFALKLALCLVMLAAAMGLASISPQPEASFAVFFLIIPQMWLVYTESAFRTAISVAAFSMLTAILVQSLGLFDQALVYQFAINVIAASAYFGLAVPGLIADNQQLRRLAMTDSLTEIWSRQSLMEQAKLEIMRAERYDDPVSIIVFDIDRFKQINDLYGHPVGDEALRKVAAAAQATLRETDVLGRFGGDEFVALLPKTDLGQACDTARRIRRALRAVKLVHIEHSISGSFGVARINRGESFRVAFERADRALYVAKNNGRDQVQWSGLGGMDDLVEEQPSPARTQPTA